jgi:hypothetical protein
MNYVVNTVKRAPLYRHWGSVQAVSTAHRESRGIVLPFLDRSTKRGEGSASRPGRSLPPGKNQYPLYRRLGGPQGRSGHARRISPPPGSDPRTVQPVTSRYTDYATRPTVNTVPWNNLSISLHQLRQNSVRNCNCLPQLLTGNIQKLNLLLLIKTVCMRNCVRTRWGSC